MKIENKVTMAIQIDKETKKEISEFAKQRGLTLSGLAKLAIYEYMKINK